MTNSEHAAEPTAFAAWLDAALTRRGWRRANLARALGVSDTTVMRWYRGGGIEFSSLRQIAALFDVPVEKLASLTGLPVSESDSRGSSLADVLSAEELRQQAEYRADWEYMRENVPRPFWKVYRDSCRALAETFKASGDTALEFLRSEVSADGIAGADGGRLTPDTGDVNRDGRQKPRRPRPGRPGGLTPASCAA